MSRSSRKLKQAKKLAQRQKIKAAKLARYQAANERRARVKEDRAGKWRAIHRAPVRHRGKPGGVVSLKVFLRSL